MRHLLWFVIGVVLTAVGLLLAAFGSGRASSGYSLADEAGRTIGYLAVLVAGLVLGLLAASRRFSPAGPLAGGPALLALGVYCWVEPQGVSRAVFGFSADLAQGSLVLVSTGAALLVGVLLLVLGLLPGAPRRPRDDGRDDDGFTAVPHSTPQAWAPPGR